MTNKEILLAAKVLDIADEEFSHYGCNDLEESVYDGWSLEERQEFVKEFHNWNGDPEEYDEDMLDLPDFAVMAFLSHKLTESISK